MKNKKFPVWLTIEQKDKTLFLGLTALYTIYVLPIILANRPCYDDIPRSLYGITGWNNDARPLTEKLVTQLSGGYPLGNVAPLPLLLSVLLLAYTLTLYAKRCLSDTGQIIPALAAGFLVIANPYFLSNLSYQFDCVTMTLALCAAILPYVVPEKKALYKIFLFSFFLCMVTFTTYQPCCGVYIGLWFLELFFMLFSARVDIPRLFVQASACAFSVIVYKYVVLNHYIRPANGGWQPDAYQFGWKADGGLFYAITQNFRVFTDLIDEFLQGVPTLPLLLFGILVVSGLGCTAWDVMHQKKPLPLRIFSLLYVLFLPAIVTFASMLPLLVLTPSIFSISAHSLVCLASTGLWAAVMIAALCRRLNRLTAILFLPCLLFGFTFSYTYGNAMASQQQYETYLTHSIVHDLETLNADNIYRAITVSGRAPRSPETARLTKKYPLFRRIVPSYLTNSSYLGGAILLQYSREVFEFDDFTEQDQILTDSTPPSLENSIYACYESGDKIIILFK